MASKIDRVHTPSVDADLTLHSRGLIFGVISHTNLYTFRYRTLPGEPDVPGPFWFKLRRLDAGMASWSLKR